MVDMVGDMAMEKSTEGRGEVQGWMEGHGEGWMIGMMPGHQMREMGGHGEGDTKDVMILVGESDGQGNGMMDTVGRKNEGHLWGGIMGPHMGLPLTGGLIRTIMRRCIGGHMMTSMATTETDGRVSATWRDMAQSDRVHR